MDHVACMKGFITMMEIMNLIVRKWEDHWVCALYTAIQKHLQRINLRLCWLEHNHSNYSLAEVKSKYDPINTLYLDILFKIIEGFYAGERQDPGFSFRTITLVSL